MIIEYVYRPRVGGFAIFKMINGLLTENPIFENLPPWKAAAICAILNAE